MNRNLSALGALVVDGCSYMPLCYALSGGFRLPGLKVRDTEHSEGALRRFKKQCEKAGVLSEVRRREYYEKPSVRRKKKSIAARKRLIKRALPPRN